MAPEAALRAVVLGSAKHVPAATARTASTGKSQQTRYPEVTCYSAGLHTMPVWPATALWSG